MNETTVLIIQFVMALVTSGVIGGIIAHFTRRENNRMKVQLATIQASREETRGESATAAGLLSVLATALEMLEPLRETLVNVALSTGESVRAADSLLKRADEMHLVVARRDVEAQQERTVRDERHQIILDRLDAQPGKVVEEMAPEFDKIPKAVEEALTPRIEELQKDIRTLIQGLDNKLSERIEAATDQIPERTTALVRDELAALQQKIETGLKAMLETAKSIEFPSDEAVEGKPVESEPTVEKVEEPNTKLSK